MFHAVIPDAKNWRNLMAAISTLVEEATFNITPEKISLRAMDPSHVAMVDMESPKETFQEYTCTEPLRLSMDIADMLKLIRRVDPGETIDLSHDAQLSQLTLKLTGKYTRRFSMPLLQPATTDMPVPKLTFDAKIEMDADFFNDVISDISGVSDQVKFEATPERLVLSGASETGNAIIEFEKTNPAIITYEAQSIVKALYGVRFLQDIVKAGATSSKMMSLEFSSDKPVKLDFKLPLGGRLVYYLAPRLE